MTRIRRYLFFASLLYSICYHEGPSDSINDLRLQNMSQLRGHPRTPEPCQMNNHFLVTERWPHCYPSAKEADFVSGAELA